MYVEKRLSDRVKSFTLFSMIPLIVFLCVVFIPFLLGIYMTFTDTNGTDLNARFNNGRNYLVAITDVSFWNSLLFTVKFVAVSLVLTNAVALCLALLTTSGIKGQNFFRLGYFTPNLIGGIILGFIWQFIFSRVFTAVGAWAHFSPLTASWLTTPGGAFWALVIVGVWQNSGYMMLIYIAGLTGIDKSLLEMAQIEGASFLKRLARIQLPLLIPAVTISVFLTLQRCFMIYDINLSLTQGGPYRSSELVAMHIYNEAFLYQRFGSGQAKALIFFAIIATASVAQVTLMKRRELEA